MQPSVAIILATFFTATLATPMTPSFFKREDTKCGITGDAPLNDCTEMINTDSIWDAEWHGDNPATCTFTNPVDNKYAYPATNPICYRECCVYTTGPQLAYGQGTSFPTEETTRSLAREILGCGSSENSVNGQARSGQQKVCLSNREGCGDCFDDAGES